jgi:glutamate---cysteine ligase / carboxylate-amine ligase
MDHSFGQRPPFTLGVEEELHLVDPITWRLVPDAARVLGALDLPERAAGHEAFAAQVELRSPISAGVDEAAGALARGRAALLAAGATPLAAGLHPDAAPGDATLTDLPRYARVKDDMRGLIQRTPEAALHVHVGMPEPNAAVRALNGLRVHLPLLGGLAASSPFWFGRDSGLASARWAVVMAYPGRGVPRAFAGWDDYCETLAAAVSASGADDYTHVWWDVRLHPRLGTVEVREMDVQTALGDAAGLSALAHCLARRAVEDDAPPVPAEALRWSAFRAARDGLDADLVAPDGAVRPLRELAAAALADARTVAGELGADGALEEVERLLRDGGGAARARAVFARGGMEALLRELVERTAAGARADPSLGFGEVAER